MFDVDDWKQERFVRNTLRKLAKQRVSMILQPGDVWVVEKAIEDSESTAEALRTCHIRGWVEILSNAVPTGSLTSEGKLPSGDLFKRTKPLYRITDAGWNAIYRTYDMVLASLIIAVVALLVSIVAMIAAIKAIPG